MYFIRKLPIISRGSSAFFNTVDGLVGNETLTTITDKLLLSKLIHAPSKWIVPGETEVK